MGNNLICEHGVMKSICGICKSANTDFLSFPEALYMVSLGPTTSMAAPVNIAVDAVSFTDVEDFFFNNLMSRSDWEILEIEKTYVYAKMYVGDDGKGIDFTIGANLSKIATHHVDELDIAEADADGVKGIDQFDWDAIIASVARRQVHKNDYSKRTPVQPATVQDLFDRSKDDEQ